MRYPVTRLLAGLTAAYGVFALARPDHLASALGEKPTQARRRLAYTYGVRDLPISALALSGRPELLAPATALRVVCDLGDSAILAGTTSGAPRAKALAVTLTWATLNTAAYLWESGRLSR